MSYAIRRQPKAQKELERVPESDQQRVVDAIHQLEENPHAGRVLKGGLQGLRRIRVGDWRVLYKIDDSVVSILRVARRRDAYRRRAR